jgi:hypothetical protein
VTSTQWMARKVAENLTHLQPEGKLHSLVFSFELSAYVGSFIACRKINVRC